MREGWQRYRAMPKFEIQLRDILLFARHGVMPEENVLGNQYRVNVRLTIDAESFDEEADVLGDTISYAEVYELLADEMARPRRLLESVAKDFGKKALERWNSVESGEIEIVKTVPPIPGMIGEAGVKYIF